MNSIALQYAVIGLAWIGAIVLAVVLLYVGYCTVRALSSEIMRRGLFPVALAPALIIAARLRATRFAGGVPVGNTVETVLRELVRAERLCPEFRGELEARFPNRHSINH